MMRAFLVAVLIFGFVLGAGDGLVGAVPTEERAAYKAECGYYADRAERRSHWSGPAYMADLAAACDAAQRSLGEARGREGLAAIAFLSRLGELRRTVDELNRDRALGDGAPGATEAEQVSVIGEYLIAHRMGLIAAYNAWLDTGPGLALASQRGR